MSGLGTLHACVARPCFQTCLSSFAMSPAPPPAPLPAVRPQPCMGAPALAAPDLFHMVPTDGSSATCRVTASAIAGACPAPAMCTILIWLSCAPAMCTVCAYERTHAATPGSKPTHYHPPSIPSYVSAPSSSPPAPKGSRCCTRKPPGSKHPQGFNPSFWVYNPMEQFSKLHSSIYNGQPHRLCLWVCVLRRQHGYFRSHASMRRRSSAIACRCFR